MATINIYEGAALHSEGAAQETWAPSPSQKDSGIQESQSSTVPMPENTAAGIQVLADHMPVPTLLNGMPLAQSKGDGSELGTTHESADSAPSPNMQVDASSMGALPTPSPSMMTNEKAGTAENDGPAPSLEPGVENEGKKKSSKELK